ncbi:MAG: DUF952 domain-containing protein [Chloroflexi bacterium]|jgi:uncharacterized protein (DUF952 family)|uniref:DUF952 domain-containing protein n=1 Tax=Candidatus Thermofonsia Clade 3 bacterium TaxID=2364212 RepID=A0A2M8QGL6_9CHLR|nr:DUF952 domain-containing protein [Candidatus Roseilinea sp. NK_OTU-006]PJF48892.1 MAG: hypothetical protein CUN48_01120 [Candidatus Thermofonsia Clade 3 bacterium]RMG66054.1 MAG: DUF952 domain-containing protein [Chloroflexota bacterium]
MILHLAPRADWEATPPEQPYRAASLATEGFIHATQGDALLLRVANTLYKNRPGEFVVLAVDESKLTSEVRWEAPTGDVIPPEATVSDTAPDDALRFPHIYGPINRDAIVAVRLATRDADGAFVGFDPLPDLANPLNLKSPGQMADELLAATDAFSEALARFKDSVEGRLAQLDEEIKKLH